MENQDLLGFEGTVDRVLKQIFFKCGQSDEHEVKVSELINYIKLFMKTEINTLDVLQKSLDPNDEDPSIDFSTFCTVAKCWIQDNFIFGSSSQERNSLDNNEDNINEKNSFCFLQTVDAASTNASEHIPGDKFEFEKLNSLVSQNELLSFEINEIKMALEISEKEKNELASKNQMLHCNTKILQDLHEQNQKLIEQVEEIGESHKKICKDLKQANLKNTQLAQRLNECEIKKCNLEEKLACFTEKYVKNTELRIDFQDEIKHRDVQIVALETDCIQLKSECEELQEQLQHYQNENEELKNKIKELEGILKQELRENLEYTKPTILKEDKTNGRFFCSLPCDEFSKTDRPFNSPTLLEQLRDPLSPIFQNLTSEISPISSSTPVHMTIYTSLLSPIHEEDSEPEEVNALEQTNMVNSSEEDFCVPQMLKNALKYSPHASLHDEILQAVNEPLNILQLQEKVKMVSEDNIQLMSDCKTYREKIDKLTTELNEKCDNVDMEKTQNEYLHKMNETIKAENKYLLENNEKLKKELNDANTKMDALIIDYNCKEYQLTKKIDDIVKECSCYRDQIGRLECNNAKLSEELESSKSETEDLYNKYQTLLEENNILNNQKQTIIKNINNTIILKDRYFAQINNLTNNLRAQEDRNRTLSLKLRGTKNLYNKLLTEFESCKKQLGISKCHINRLKSQNVELKGTINKYECKNVVICQENKSLKEHCAELKDHQKKLEIENEKLKNFINSSGSQNKNKGTFNKMHNKIDKLEDQNMNLRNTVSAYKIEKREHEEFESEMIDILKEQRRLLQCSVLQTFNQWQVQLQNFEETADLEVSVLHFEDYTVWGPKKPLEEEIDYIKKQVEHTVVLLQLLCKINTSSNSKVLANADNNSLNQLGNDGDGPENVIPNIPSVAETSFTDDHKFDAAKEIQQKLHDALLILESFSSASVKHKCKEQRRRMEDVSRCSQQEILKLKEILMKIQSAHPEIAEVADSLLQLDVIIQFSSRVSMCAMQHGLLNRNARFIKCVNVITKCVLLLNTILKQTKQAKSFLVNERAILKLFNNFGELQNLYEQEENAEFSISSASASTESSIVSRTYKCNVMKKTSALITMICLFGVFVYYLFNREERSLNECPAYSASSKDVYKPPY